MNRIKAAENKLRKLDGLRMALENIPLDLQFLEQENGDPGKLRALRKSLEKAQQQVKAMERALSVLSPEEKLVLYRFFICPEPRAVEQLCLELGLEHFSIYRRRSKGLEKFALALYGDCSGA